IVAWLRRLPGGAQRIDSGTAAFLEVDAGVGAVTVALCQAVPGLRVLALEPGPAPHAAATIAAAGLRDRVELRAQRVEELTDTARSRLRLAADRLHAHPGRAHRAAHRRPRPGFWWGSDALLTDQAETLLRDAGYDPVLCTPSPPGQPSAFAARRPDSQSKEAEQ
ncbi:MAG TPA: hypothetical protein VEO01_01015, partial [Pseudonocardiaceae bacterium]|nr:hypothetical protein [Pseudonocardiaceae bacterium]